MLDINAGKPIAMLDNTRVYLGVVDPDLEPPKPKRRRTRGRNYDSDEEEEGALFFDYPAPKKLYPVPDLNSRFVEYIAGPSGSGKSTMATNLAAEFRAVYPKIPILIFSRTKPEDDDAFADLDGAIVIELNEKLIEQPVDITKDPSFLEGSLLIFDDVSTVHSDAVKKEVNKLLTDAMEVGRKLNCNMIITNHLVIPNEKKLARTIMNELNMLTVFPKCGSSQQIRYSLKTYFGLNNKQIDGILSLKSRWVRICKSYPMFVLHEHGAYIL